jgi:type I restriction enzyme S subunit
LSFNRFFVEQLAASERNAIVGGPFGSNLVSKDYVDAGVPVIRGQNMSSRWVCGEFAFVTDEKAKALSPNKARPGDLVFTQRGTLGQVAVVPAEPYPEYIVSQSQMKLTVDANKADVMFLYYLFRSPEQLEYIRNTAIQTGVPHTNLGILKQTPVSLPSLSEQKMVAELLAALDDRIDLLRETSATLEAIAQALFKSWFVDFDPVRAKRDGRSPEGMDEATAGLFPDSFEDSDREDVPRGWKIRSFDHTVQVFGGGTPKTSIETYWGGAIPWFSVVDAPSPGEVFVLRTEKTITEEGLRNSSTKLLPEGTTIISARGTVGRLALTACPMTMNQSCYGLRGKAGDTFFTYYSTKRLVDALQQRAHGSVFDTITLGTLSGVSVVQPDGPTIAAFDATVASILERIRVNLTHAQALVGIRDTLLPRLISGQLRLPEVADTVREAVA